MRALPVNVPKLHDKKPMPVIALGDLRDPHVGACPWRPCTRVGSTAGIGQCVVIADRDGEGLTNLTDPPRAGIGERAARHQEDHCEQQSAGCHPRWLWDSCTCPSDRLRRAAVEM